MDKQLQNDTPRRLPEIMVGGTDLARLTSLATAASNRSPHTAEELL